MRIVIAGDDELVLNGVKNALARDEDVDVQMAMAMAADADMDHLLDLPKPDLYVICLELITAETVDSLFRLRSAGGSPAIPVLVLVAGACEWASRLVRHGLCVVTRNRLPSGQLAAMAVLMTAGYLPVPRRDVEGVLADVAVMDERPRDCAARKLSRREREVFELVRAGMTNPQIAGALSIARSTVKSHIESILGKLGLRSRVEIILSPPSQGGRLENDRR